MYLYIKRYVDLTGAPVNTNKKIGISKNVDERRRGLNGTLGPIQYETMAAWKIGENVRQVEHALHALLSDKRTFGEHFEDEDDSLVEGLAALMSAFGCQPENLGELEPEPPTPFSNRMDELAADVQPQLVARGIGFTVNKSWHRVHKGGNTLYLQARVNGVKVHVDGNNVMRIGEIAKSVFKDGIAVDDERHIAITADRERLAENIIKIFTHESLDSVDAEETPQE
jgi:hypothetical protein